MSLSKHPDTLLKRTWGGVTGFLREAAVWLLFQELRWDWLSAPSGLFSYHMSGHMALRGAKNSRCGQGASERSGHHHEGAVS